MRAKNLTVLTNEIKKNYPGVVVYGIGDEKHKLSLSDHNEDDTVGVRAAQTDPDTEPEHRAIDIMLGPAFSRSQANALIQQLLTDKKKRDRLYYIIFDGRIWSRSNGWVEKPKTTDPHREHVHISGWAANDEDDSPWGITLEDEDMTPGQAKELHDLHEMVFWNVRPWLQDYLPQLLALLKTVAEKVDIDTAELDAIGERARQAMAEALTPEKLAEAIPDSLAQDVLDALSARLANKTERS